MSKIKAPSAQKLSTRGVNNDKGGGAESCAST